LVLISGFCFCLLWAFNHVLMEIGSPGYLVSKWMFLFYVGGNMRAQPNPNGSSMEIDFCIILTRFRVSLYCKRQFIFIHKTIFLFVIYLSN
jgi:hypothetical protein